MLESLGDFYLATLAVWAAWDVGRRFAEGRSNRELLRRVTALEGVDHASRDIRLNDVEHTLTGVKNQLETMRARSQTRWGG